MHYLLGNQYSKDYDFKAKARQLQSNYRSVILKVEPTPKSQRGS